MIYKKNITDFSVYSDNITKLNRYQVCLLLRDYFQFAINFALFLIVNASVVSLF